MTAIAERPHTACFVLDKCPALFAKSQNCILGHSVGASGAIQALYINVSMQRNIVAEFHRENASFIRKTAS